MTGITKDELMQMAREAGMKEMQQFRSPTLYTFKKDDLESMFNAILERAAVECEEKAKSLWATAEMMENELMEKVGDGARECCESIRALKINTGD